MYVLTGTPTVADSIERRALVKVLHAICHRLGIDYIFALESAYEEVKVEAGTPDKLRDIGIPSLLEEVESAVFDAMTKIELNSDLLAEVIAAIESIEEMNDLVLSPQKKADLSVMLYRAFRPTSKVDFAVVEQAVNLAAS